VHLKTLQGEQELGESFEDSKTKSQEGQRSHTCVRRVEKKQRSRPLGSSKFFHVWEESAQEA
jgi:hypothetical protein